MPKISFHGLCGFSRPKGATEVRVVMPDAHGHKASMQIDLADVDLTTLKWRPNDVRPSPSGEQIGVWTLGPDEGLDLRAGQDGDPAELPDDLIEMAHFHTGLTLRQTSGVSMVLKGGKLETKEKYPRGLKVQKRNPTDETAQFKSYAEIVRWSSGERTIASRHGSIALKSGSAEVAIINTVPGFSPGHEGLKHFAGYYAALKLADKDVECELVIEPEDESITGLKNEFKILTAGAGNCVPNAELP